MPRRAVIVSVGTELTEGIIQDTHVRFLAAALSGLGFTEARAAVLPDEAAGFRAELARATGEADLVIVTGGLGPTTDDLAREVIAEVAGVPLAFHQESWDRILVRFAGRAVPESNRKQAMAPAGFTLLPNANGTAPGFRGSIGRAIVVALPGPPGELRPMFADLVVPQLREHFGMAVELPYLRGTAFMTPESALEEALRGARREGVSWGTRVEEDRIAFSLRGGSEADREACFEGVAMALGRVRVHRGETRPANLLLGALEAAGLVLVTAESCTGGLIGRYLTDVPGSSRGYWGGVVSYANAAKERMLGVPAAVLERHGAVSAETVVAMARGALAVSGAGLALAVSGIAGPDGGTPEKPVGTVWLATARQGADPACVSCRFSGGRDAVRRKAAVAGLLAAAAAAGGRPFLDSLVAW
ncbi:MAG: CinA-like protein [Chloroflexota bacterium]|nr:CinA-like protein [Chloroflexota bacterium]